MTAEHGGLPLKIVEDATALASAGADIVVETVRQATSGGRRCHIALAGGSTPRVLYALLAEPPRAEEIPWQDVEVWWGDERCVGPDSPESNYRMAREALLSKVPIPEGNIHRLRGEHPDPEAAAAAYATEVRQAFNLADGELPHLDLVLLGMGPDGHTASLFPDTDAVRITDRLVAAPYVPHLNAHRLTLTLPVLKAARRVVFLVGGADKREMLRAVAASGPAGDPALPSSLVRPTDGTLLWLVDRLAAGADAPAG